MPRDGFNSGEFFLVALWILIRLVIINLEVDRHESVPQIVAFSLLKRNRLPNYSKWFGYNAQGFCVEVIQKPGERDG